MAGTDRFDAFISYRRGEDGDTGIAKCVQERLHLTGRAWHRLRRPLRVFRDDTNTTFSADLREALEGPLRSATWLILIASPAAAGSTWVRHEVDWWTKNRSLDQLVLVHADGTISWDPMTSRFSDETDALPPALLTTVTREPLWVSLVPEGKGQRPDDGSAELALLLDAAAARISAGIRGMSLDEVVGDHLRQRRLAARIMVTVTAVMTALAMAASLTGIEFYTQRNEARFQRDQAVSRQVATQANALRATDPALARQFSMAAYTTSPTVEARSQLLSSPSMPAETRMPDHTGPTFASATSPDGRLLVTAGADGYVTAWDVRNVNSPQVLSRVMVDPNGVFAVALSRNTRILATGDDDGHITLWDISDPHHIDRLSVITAHSARVTSVAFGATDSLVANGADDGRVQLWNVIDFRSPTPAGPPLTGHTRGVNAVAFSPDGRLLATGSSDRTIRLWHVTDPAHAELATTPLTGHTSDVTAVAFAPSGTTPVPTMTLASAGIDGTVRLWRIASSGAATEDGQPLTGHTNAVYAVAFSADGHRLASGSNDDTTRIWDRLTHRLLATMPQPESIQTLSFLGSSDQLTTGGNDGQLRIWHLNGPVMSSGQGPLVSAVLSPDARLAATGSVDNSVQLWTMTDLDHPEPVGPPLLGHATAVDRMAFRSDSQLLAVPSDDHTIDLWDVTDPARPRMTAPPLTGSTSPVTSVAFSPDGHLLVSGDKNGVLMFWDVTDPTHPTHAAAPIADRQGGIFDVTISPDGRTLAASGGDQTTRLYDLTDRQHPSILGDPLAGHTQSVLAVAFSIDGHTLATAGEDGIVWLWDVTNHAHPTALAGPLRNTGGATIDVTIGPDGQLAAANSDGSVWLWHTESHHAALQARLIGSNAAVYAAQFAPDGHHLLTGSADGTATIWNTSTADVSSVICSTAGAPLSGQEWAAYAPGVTPVPTC